MKKVIFAIFILCGFCSIKAQDLVQGIQKLTLENDSLQKQVIKPLQDSLVNLTSVHLAEVAELREQISALETDSVALTKKIKAYEKEVADLNKNKVRTERDSLKKQVTYLQTEVILLNQTIDEKEEQITEQQKIGEEKSQTEKEKIKSRLLADIAATYKNRTFDELIKSTTKQVVERDKKLIGNNEEIIPLLVALENYFIAEKLLAQKYDRSLIQEAETHLKQIEESSELVDKLKVNMEYYSDFSNELRKTVENLVDLDKRKTAGNEEEVQKKKLNEVLPVLYDYMYNYYDYEQYPYLSDIVFEIIKRKLSHADADLTDLLVKLS